jgi:hypothetical protein
LRRTDHTQDEQGSGESKVSPKEGEAMTAEEEFEKWMASNTLGLNRLEREIAKYAYIAATKRTAQRCVEICNERARYKADTRHGRDLNVAVYGCAQAIENEFSL